MGKHILKYLFLALLFIPLVLASGLCYHGDCSDPTRCKEFCAYIGSKKANCSDNECCCD
ncbi:hypothetical protein MtrunA17_Chr7g0237961 [Medicago truncatula]|uniref:LCR-like protein n=1 Tax=Medicago truncatula TaxID=3880 RepID=A0A072UAK0_MEDTR|nr:LCR-like protein [Medicago truncatula]RHN46041.1 hypothetical protein MtrunA17_Chr7g0237961 [Medicago truncatula]